MKKEMYFWLSIKIETLLIYDITKDQEIHGVLRRTWQTAKCDPVTDSLRNAFFDLIPLTQLFKLDLNLHVLNVTQTAKKIFPLILGCKFKFDVDLKFSRFVDCM